MLLKKIKKLFCFIKSAKISLKITAVYAVMFILVLLVLNASILFGVRHYIYEEGKKQIEDVQNIMTNKLKNKQVNLNVDDIFSDVPSKENISIRILLKNGKVINETTEFDHRIKKTHEDKEILKFNGKHLKDDEKHLIYKNILIITKRNEKIYLQIYKDMHTEYYYMKVLFGIMVLADFIGIIVSIFLGYVISKKMLKPIDYITKTAENISINNLKERIEVTGADDELKRLSNTFNKMIDRLQDAFDRQAQFVSNASHELRTPITVIQGYANLLDRWGKNDKNALEKSIYGIKFEAANMAELIEKLLFLAKGDTGTYFFEKKEFYLNEIINSLVSEGLLISKNHKILSSRNDKVKISADSKMIKQMLRIFIDNSIKFTPRGGTIDISSILFNDEVKISVKDTGIGIPKDEIKNIFDRFYIVDKSRSKERGGSGLGLSIAKWIVNMHNGIIGVESEEGKFTKITVTLKVK
ncbi:sensor histidine kinase [Clostridium felsineum]|uniref:sensor histidine kinase n=1 Tax=Clostridium felsineum TaxID=36839 RepID=UPI00098C67B2|nr:ATP-binding protein [Clostridium felsineum]URZ04332.1 Adaptive-response sensory-kinase SasA [Clostridium felsineum]